MKKILFTILFTTFLLISCTETIPFEIIPIVSVVDGDTIKSNLSWRMPNPLNKVSIRIYGINTPEMPAKSYPTTGKLGRAKCVKEAELALKAKRYVIKMINNNTKMQITNFKWDKFGGRILADVSVGGIDIGKSLLKEGLAVEYFGKGIKKDWCK